MSVRAVTAAGARSHLRRSSHAHDVANTLKKRYFGLGFEARPLRLYIDAAINRIRRLELASCIQENSPQLGVELRNDVGALVRVHADACPRREVIGGNKEGAD